MAPVREQHGCLPSTRWAHLTEQRLVVFLTNVSLHLVLVSKPSLYLLNLTQHNGGGHLACDRPGSALLQHEHVCQPKPHLEVGWLTDLQQDGL